MLLLYAATLRSIERSDDRETDFCGHPFSTLPLENPVFLQLRWNSHLRQIGQQFRPPNRHATDAHPIAADEAGERGNGLAVEQLVDVLGGRNGHPVVDEQFLRTCGD